jgi:diguanylate cyclase (GGDEF)-like protein
MLLRSEDELSQLISSFQGMTQSLLRSRNVQAASMEALTNEKSMLDTLLATMPIGVVFADHTQVCYCNDSFRRMFQFGQNEQIVGMKNDRLLLQITQNVADADTALKAITSILASRKLTDPAYITLKNGRILRLLSNVVIAPESSNYLGRFWLFEDQTKEQKVLQMAELNAEHDALTSIYNRRRFDLDLPRMLAQAERDQSRLALMIFDLDEFKPINDIYGHEYGDIVLKQVAQSLSAQLRRNEVLYRIGGDEFALLLVNISDDEVKIIADRNVTLVSSLAFGFKGAIVKVGCSLGIASYPDAADTPQDLLKLADQAMYEAKKSGKSQYVIGKRPGLAQADQV